MSHHNQSTLRSAATGRDTATAAEPLAAGFSLLPGLPVRRRPSTDGRLDGRVALVTGAAGTLGGAIAARFTAAGASVLFTDLDTERCRRGAADLTAECPGSKVLGTALDVTDEADWTRALRTARRHLGPVDILVNAAGVVDLQRIDLIDPLRWQQVVEVNQTALLTGIRACLPTMWKAGGGAVVSIGSIFGSVGTGSSFAYHTTKGAVQAMTTAAAVELACRRIRVNAVLPGLIPSDLTSQLSEEFVASHQSSTPLARLAEPADVAAAALFLASDEADFITGVCLPVDGGYVAC